VSNRYVASINKPGFNPLGVQTSTNTYYPYLYSWGRNSVGALGIGNNTDYSSPKQVGALSDWRVISASVSNSSLSVKTDGTLWSWGNNFYGQLGSNNTTRYSSPKQVGALTNWLTVSSGQYSTTAAIKTDGTLWTWGQNNYGQLGLGNTTDYSSPKQVGALTNWSKLGVGIYAVYSIKTDGTLWAWGYNNSGQLGLGNITSYSSPKQIGALTNWSNVSGSQGYWAAAVKTDGTLWTWGYNNYGQLGLGNRTDYSSPKQVGALTSWLSVSGGQYWCLALKTDGTLWSWGYNVSGQLGLNNTTYYSSPKQVGSLTTWASISAAFRTGYAVKTNGTLWDWGYNSYGNLGNGTSGNPTHTSSPAQIGALTTWLSVSSTYAYAFALLY
jgi:alpha-tubulin suppressor-like RCC1 family protein